MTTSRFEYEGPVYIKPVGRGIVLEETKAFLLDEIERLVGSDPGHGWAGRLRIIVEAEGPDDGVRPGAVPPAEMRFDHLEAGWLDELRRTRLDPG